MAAGMARKLHGGFGPTSVTAIRLKNVRIIIVSSEKILKNQLLRRVLISNLATVRMFSRESILF